MEPLKFEDLNLSKELRKAIENMGFEEATPIQSEAIPLILEGKDVIGQAQTGTGKTVAFGIPILEVVQPKKPQASGDHTLSYPRAGHTGGRGVQETLEV